MSTLPPTTLVSVVPSSTFQLSNEAPDQVSALTMKVVEWRVLYEVDGFRTVREIGKRLSLEEGEVCAIFMKLFDFGLIEEYEISLNDFLRRRQELQESHQPAPAPPTPAKGPASDAAVAAAAVGAVRGSCPSDTSSSKIALQSVPPLPPLPAPPHEHRLKSVIDFVFDRVGRGTDGQLVLYRIFMGIRPDLLRRAKIESLDLADDKTIVADPELRDAISEAVQRVLGVTWDWDGAALAR